MRKIIITICAVLTATILNAGAIADYAKTLNTNGTFRECVATAKNTINDVDAIKADVVEWGKAFAELSHNEKIARKNERAVACVGLGRDWALWLKIPYDAGRYINHWYTIEARNVGTWYADVKANGFVIEGKNQSYFKSEIAFVCGDYEYATYLPVNELLNSPYWLKAIKKQFSQEKDFVKLYDQLCKIDAYFYAHNMDGSSEHDVLQDLMKRCVSRITNKKLIQ